MSALVIGGFRNGSLEPGVLEAISGAMLFDGEVRLFLYTKESVASIQERVKGLGLKAVSVLAVNGDFELAWDEVLGAIGEVLNDAVSAVVLPADAFSAALSPRLAFKLKVGIVSDCTGIVKEPGKIRMLKAVFGSKAVAVYEMNTKPVVLTLKKGAFEPCMEKESPGETIFTMFESQVAPAFKLVEVRREDAGEDKLEEARVVVSGGRGMGSAEGFSQLKELARALGASVGGSRAAVDAGWIGSSRQVGLTGKSVRAEIYIAVGISGASQHMAGLSSVKKIVAINSNPEAPIFEAASIGLVADYKQLLPLMIESIKKGAAEGLVV